MSAAEDDTPDVTGPAKIVDPEHEFTYDIGFGFINILEIKRGDEVQVSHVTWTVFDRCLMMKRGERTPKEYYKLKCLHQDGQRPRTFKTTYWLTVKEVQDMMDA